MLRIRDTGFPLFILAAFSSSAIAQTGSTSSAAAPTSLATTGSGTTSSSSSSSNPASSLTNAPILTAPSTTSSGNTTQTSASNFLGPTFGQPYYQGTLTNAQNFATPGGFGKTMFAASGGTGGGNIPFAATSIGTTNTTATRRGGASGILADQGGNFVQIPRQIAYPAQMKFASPTGLTEKTIAELRSTLPSYVTFQMDGNSVTLRGAVQTIEQSQLIEGLVRLTPGVGQIKNDLSITSR